jgi:UDP-N-acetylglucosamine--N-acetylmuramyl-(pentapeptide) pyrophosphoryl-undecaprenol N-acetylglucosamine transferase
LLVHEQVVVPGLANRFIGRLADRVAVTFAASASAFPRGKVVVTGNPIRPELLLGQRARAFERFGLDPAFPLTYVTGGALGAHRVNRVVGALSPHCSRRPRSSTNAATTRTAISRGSAARPGGSRPARRSVPGRRPRRRRSWGTSTPPPASWSAARAPAPWPSWPRSDCPRSSCRSPELAATSKPPTRGSSPTRAPPVLLPRADLTPDRLVREVTQLLAQPERLRTMAGAPGRSRRPDAAERLVDLVLGLTRDA